MKYHELQADAHKKSKRRGRGDASGLGKTSGRGTKGQGARTGKKIHAVFEGGQNATMSAVPKSRGFKSFKKPAQVVYLDQLNALKGKTADNQTLYEQGLIQTPFHKVKVILRGELKDAVTLRVQAASKSVKEAVVKAGGTFEVVTTPRPKSAKEAEKADTARN